MNKNQRKDIQKELGNLTEQIGALGELSDQDTPQERDGVLSTLSTIEGKLDDIKTFFETQRDMEEEKFDNMSEGLQASEKGQALEASKEALDGVCDAIGEAVASINEVGEDSDEEEMESALSSARDSLNTAEGLADEAMAG